ncbi:antibiotic biosynthesis monooxygenase [Lacunisphaera limnophila]|uniref:antibiotic biosynthesis monooxygenase n=1 Tax=Lacunisphaera limnophila TaxID=1838286 RepID=UPI00085972CB|nr:antibiotic biosynthesis monooxygenase [Lacunisphaera limnophila]
MQPRDQAVSPSGPQVLILHEVQAYAPWKRVFDSAATIRKAAGELSYQVLRDEANVLLIVHLSTWTSHADARRFFESPRLEQIRQEAGVAAPRFLYLHPLEAGVL